MTTYVSTKELHTDLKSVTDKVISGQTVIVMKYSKPVYKLVPYQDDVSQKKYSMKDLDAFVFSGLEKNGNNLSMTYKDLLY